MRVANIDRFDLVNNPGDDGASLTIWFSGCSKKCKGCHNQKLMDPNAGTEVSVESIVGLIDPSVHKSVVLLGGEPLEQPTYELLKLITEVYRVSPDIKIWLYTGNELDDVPLAIRYSIYAIKTGPYIEELKTEKGRLASSNQKMFIINNNKKEFEEVSI